MKKIIVLLVTSITINNQLHAQGCIAIRGIGGMCMLGSMQADTSINGSLQLTTVTLTRTNILWVPMNKNNA